MNKVSMMAVILLMAAINAFSQTAADSAGYKGVHFEQGLSWDQVKAKAKSESKYIFVDCYATWCGPCKMMDEKVYTLKDVGDYFNKHFISVKVQLDKTDTDDSLVRKWYNEAVNIQKNYSVNAFPTFLFFSP